ncbi:hypothetical protein BB561_004284 [Smittium simulii]|uniref:Uncharacterized protein n=1 Tax=Smittium simulii TaxID=133385 RepID=A0A2T9YH70_9FUNG|nr:hypothetical protein BB561_004284 [Smittium simulii]
MSKNIWVAIADEEFDVVKQLINSNEFTANSQDDNGYSPMHAAASYKNIEILQYLLDNKGDPNILDKDELAKAICEHAGIPFELPEESHSEDNAEKVELGDLEGLTSEENLNMIMNYIISNAENVDLNDEEALQKLVSEYLLKNLSDKDASDVNKTPENI